MSSGGNFFSPYTKLARKEKPRPPRPREVSPEEMEEIKQAFHLFDTDKTGVLEYRELKVAMRALGFDVKKQDVLKILAEHERDGSGTIGFDEFKEVMVERILSRDPAAEMEKAFELFNVYNEGKITARDLLSIAKELGEHIDYEELQDMIAEFDTDGDGAINRKEFEAIMLAHHE